MKKKLFIILFMAVSIMVGILLVKGDEIYLEQVVKLRELKKTHYDDEPTITEVISYEVDPEVKDDFPEDLISYLCEALQNGQLTEQLLKIPAEYKKLNKWEMANIIRRSTGDYIADYQAFYANETDEWYRVSLMDSDEGYNVVIKHTLEQGNIETYFFMDIDCMAQPWSFWGQKESIPYFIVWDNKNYMAIPSWDESESRLEGVALYNFWDNCAVGIGINEASEIYVCYQTGLPGSYDGYLLEIPMNEDESIGFRDWDVNSYGVLPTYSNIGYLECEENPEGKIPENLIAELSQAMQNGTIIDYMNSIPADYTQMTDEEWEQCAKSDETGKMESFYYDVKEEDVESFYFHQNDAVIVRHKYDNEKYPYIYYKFHRHEEVEDDRIEYGIAEYAFGGNEDYYFIHWEGEDYLAVTRTTEDGTQVTGVAVYCMYHNAFTGWVLCLEKGADEEIQKRYYSYVNNKRGDIGAEFPEF